MDDRLEIATFWLPEQIFGTSVVASLPISSAEVATGLKSFEVTQLDVIH